MPQFQGKSLTKVNLAGRDFLVGPLTMGMSRRIGQAIAKVPPPKPVTVDVQGLVESMYRAGRDRDETVGEVAGPLKVVELAKIRQDISNAVQEMVREARAIAEQWPPETTTPRGMDLILTDPNVQETFLWEMLHRHNADFRREDVADLIEDMTVREFGELFSVAFAMKDDEGREEGSGPDPKSPAAGGDGASSVPPVASDRPADPSRPAA